MKSEFIKCELCKAKIPSGSVCELATNRTVIDGKEYVFCCVKCMQRYQKKRRKKTFVARVMVEPN